MHRIQLSPTGPADKGEVAVRGAEPYPPPQLCLLPRPDSDSPPGAPVPGILQARLLEWVAIAFSCPSRGSPKGEAVPLPWDWLLLESGRPRNAAGSVFTDQVFPGKPEIQIFPWIHQSFFFFLISRLFSRAALDYKKKKHGKYREFAYTLYLTLTPVSRLINILHWCGTLVATDESILMH